MYEAYVSEKIRHEMPDSLQYPVYEASCTGLDLCMKRMSQRK